MIVNSCRWVQSRLPLLAGNDLVGPDRRRTERHLVTCPECRRHLSALRDVLGTLHRAAEIPALRPGDDRPLWPALARQIRESRRSSPFAIPWRPAISPTFALSATLLLTLVAALIWPDRAAQRTSTARPAVARPVVENPSSPLVASEEPVWSDSERERVKGAASRPRRALESEHAVLAPQPTHDTH